MITITENAQAEVVRIFASESPGENSGLRLGVEGGGCSGLSYKITFDAEKEHDNVIDFPTFKVFIDPKSSIYLKGIILDFQDGLDSKGFVFNNPNAQNTCGCGESFSL